MAIDRSKFLVRFMDEAKEHCSRLSDGLLMLENSPDDKDVLNGLFRAAHTIKGSARMMKLAGISELAHWMEELLDSARSGRARLSTGSFGLLLGSVDALNLMLAEAGAGNESPDAPVDLCEALRKEAMSVNLQTGQAPPSRNSMNGKVSEDVSQVQAADTEKNFDANAGKQPAGHSTLTSTRNEYLRVNSSKLDDLIRLMGEIISDHNRFRMDVQAMHEAFRKASGFSGEVFAFLDAVKPDMADSAQVAENCEAAQASLRQTIQNVIDRVEMQDHLIGELQDATLKLRMLPLSTFFEPLRRTVRDLAMESGKDVDFVVNGGDTELDRKIAERIGDSLMHMIRNALDHGIESPSERIATGKPSKGIIALTAFYDGGGVTMVLQDDGRGLDQDRIRAKALARRLYDAETLARMSRAEIHNLVFLPGFSTSPIITDISGRGVGMDVVRQNIVNELKGSINIETRQGMGTSIFLHLPLNLAVFPLFLMRAADMTVALPATAIVEMHTVTKDDIISIVGKQAIRLREQIVPVESLSAVLKLDGDNTSEKENALVVVKDGENKLGLLVDEILGREEMVVKPLPDHLKNLRIVTGGTIGMGDSIVNVLHVPEIIRLASESTAVLKVSPEAKGTLILVVDDSINTREIAKSILEAHGYAVETAEDGQEAFEKTRDTFYDLIITDVEMPRLDGFSLTERLRADQRYLGVPIIIVTSLEKDADRKRGILAGADAYIVKQAFDQSNLLDTIRNLIGD